MSEWTQRSIYILASIGLLSFMCIIYMIYCIGIFFTDAFVIDEVISFMFVRHNSRLILISPTELRLIGGKKGSESRWFDPDKQIPLPYAQSEGTNIGSFYQVKNVLFWRNVVGNIISLSYDEWKIRTLPNQECESLLGARGNELFCLLEAHGETAKIITYNPLSGNRKEIAAIDYTPLTGVYNDKYGLLLVKPNGIIESATTSTDLFKIPESIVEDGGYYSLSNWSDDRLCFSWSRGIILVDEERSTRTDLASNNCLISSTVWSCNDMSCPSVFLCIVRQMNNVKYLYCFLEAHGAFIRLADVSPDNSGVFAECR